MNKYISIKLLLFLFPFIFMGCKKEDNNSNNSCPYFLEAPPRYMFAPDSARTDSMITITIDYNNQLSCQQFHSFLSNTIDSTTTISMQTEIDSCDCQDQFEPQFRYFQYQAPSTPGHSIIRIHVVNNLFYSDTIVIY